nr:HTH domain-containing protein [Bifidobacterium catenulatum]
MVVRQKTFTLEEAAYLRSLPAVKEVSASRITYANWFKVECVRRYLKGEPARRIFREAGLEPSLIGSKRIERCVSRWKSDGFIMGEAAKEKTEDLDDEKSNIDAVGGGFQSPRPCWKITTSPMRRSWLSATAKTDERCSTCAT